MLIANTDYISGRKLMTLSLVKGSTVQCKNLGKDILSGFKNLVGGEVTAYTLFVSCFALFLPGDCAQCLLSAMIARRAIPLLDRGSRT